MRTVSGLSLLLAAILAASLAQPTLGKDQTAADIAKNAYHDDTLTPTEREAVAEEENVTPNDGRRSTPAPGDRGVIPDIDEPVTGGKAQAPTPAKPETGESEAAVVLDDAKKNDRVTRKDISECLAQWDPQTQMSKEEWGESCRTTLEYFPEGN